MPNIPSRGRVLRGPLLFSVLLSICGTILAVTPAAAAPTTSSTYGAEVWCMYKSVPPPSTSWSGQMKLKKIKVMPPTTMFATQPSQVVGLRLIVQRQFGDNAPWKRIFKSDIQRVTATSDVAAAFTEMSAPIRIQPFPGGNKAVDFRVNLFFYWFNDDGTVQNMERVRVGEYPSYRDGVYQWVSYPTCHHSWLFT